MRNKLHTFSILPIEALLIIHFSIIVPIWSGKVAQAQWVHLSNGMGNQFVSSFVANGNYIFAGSNENGVYLSTSNGVNWTQTTLNNRTIWSLAANSNYIFAGTDWYGVYVSMDNGVNWAQTSLNNKTVWSITADVNFIFAGTWGNGLYLSTNNGIGWTHTYLDSIVVYSLAVNGNRTFAGNGGIILSTNHGTNWTQAFLINHSIYSLATSGNYIYAGSDINGVYLSTNNGSNWVQSSLNTHVVYSLAANGNNIFAGTDIGVFVSNNIGQNWVLRNEGLGNNFVYSLYIFNSFIFAGTNYGVYRRPLGELIGIKPISEQIPESYSLSQNYPNPFNPTTKIKFQVPLSKGGLRGLSLVLLKIYDILGREITTLVNQQLKPGTYEVDWDGSNYPSGVYFYRLETPDYVDAKKMILLK